jgi:predicted enzyme related to lactoylglutathione lyase
LQALSSDVPTMWLQYITVDDCDAALARAKQNGATVVAEPVDAEGVGRFGILRDPIGGMIGVIKPASA